MSETKWTPGPWHVADDHHLRAVLDVRDGDGWDVATLYSGRGDADTQDSSGVWQDDPVRIANAHLIAGAPGLYEALDHCETLLMRYEINRVDGDAIADEALTKIRAAMAKARGEA